MKTKIILLLAIISIAFTACNLEGESNYVPEIFLQNSPPIIWATHLTYIILMKQVRTGSIQ